MAPGLAGSRTFLLGFGGIGQALARRLLALGLQVKALRRSSARLGLAGVEAAIDLADLLRSSEHLVRVAPGATATHHLLDAAALALALALAQPGLHLVKLEVDLDGNIIGAAWGIHQAGYVVHSAIHAARDDAQCIAHVRFHTDDGVALHRDERTRLVADLGQHHQLLLCNHGTLAIGRTAAQVRSRTAGLEKAASAQVRALGAGRTGVRGTARHARRRGTPTGQRLCAQPGRAATPRRADLAGDAPQGGAPPALF